MGGGPRRAGSSLGPPFVGAGRRGSSRVVRGAPPAASSGWCHGCGHGGPVSGGAVIVVATSGGGGGMAVDAGITVDGGAGW